MDGDQKIGRKQSFPFRPPFATGVSTPRKVPGRSLEIDGNRQTRLGKLFDPAHTQEPFSLAIIAADTLEFVVHNQSFRIGVNPRGNEKDRQRSSQNRSQETPHASENSTSQKIAFSRFGRAGVTGVFFLQTVLNFGRCCYFFKGLVLR